MSQAGSPSGARVVGAVSTAIALVALLAACTPGADDGDPSSSPSSTTSPSASRSAAAPPSPSSTPSSNTPPSSPDPSPAAGTPLDVSCLDLVPLATMYEFDPNFGLDDDYSPAVSSPAADVVAASGVSCGWVQQTSGEVIEIAAARPSADALASLRADAGSDRAFSAVDGRGVVQVFSGPYWVVAVSSYFTTADDAALLVDSAVAAVG